MVPTRKLLHTLVFNCCIRLGHTGKRSLLSRSHVVDLLGVVVGSQTAVSDGSASKSPLQLIMSTSLTAHQSPKNLLIVAGLASSAALLTWAVSFLRRPSPRKLRQVPGTIEVYSRALFGAFTKPSYPKSLDGYEAVELSLEEGVAPESSRLEAYVELVARIFGAVPNLPSDQVPPLFLYADSFRLVMSATAQPQFGFNPIGTVLAGARVRIERPVLKTEKLRYSVRIDPQRYAWSDKKDAECWVEITASDENGKLVWKSEILMVALNPKRKQIGGGHAEHKQDSSEKLEDQNRLLLARLQVPADAGRAFGAISGDRNPVHMFSASARLFGYKQPIAHAMMLVGCLELALRSSTDAGHRERRYPLELECEFKRPTLLPALLDAVLLDEKGIGELDMALAYAEGKSAGKEVITMKLKEGV